jgi:hypothetical protein
MERHAIFLTFALLAACAGSTTPNYDLRFGAAVREARGLMIIDPAAGAHGAAIAGMDGAAAAEAMGRYHDAFRAPPPVVNVINIGGGAGTSK